jgi:hypothetical protein
MSIQTYQLARDMERAFNQIGASMMTADFAAKLLAYVYVMGGGNEAVTMHEALNAGIAIAQQKFNISGGETPSAQGVTLIKKYIAELEKDLEETPWLNEILNRYNLIHIDRELKKNSSKKKEMIYG